MKKRIYDFILWHPRLCRRAAQIPLIALCVFIGLENGFLIIPLLMAMGYLKIMYFYEKDIQEYALLKAHREHREKFGPLMKKIDENLSLLDEGNFEVPHRILH
jgi:hypothetical protein